VPARERIVTTAYELFTRRGIHAVGIDEVIERAGVAKATLYRHFPTKDDLVLAVLTRREELWSLGLIEAQSRRRGNTAEEQLLAIFDVLHQWYRQRDPFEGCTFIHVLLHLGAAHRLGQAAISHIENICAMVRRRADAAGLLDVDNFARSFVLLMEGATISAIEGDPEAAHRAQDMARTLIERHRSSAPSRI
jgi:AcrR family transcriptional regulator